MNSLTFKPLTDRFGAEVLGIELAAKISEETLHLLSEAFVHKQVLLFRNQHLTTEQYAEFGRRWGVKTRVDSFTEMHVPGFDDMNLIGNVGDLFADPDYRNGASFWHTDCAAEPDPDATTMLYCLKAPQRDGETVIADMQSAYDDLDSEIKAKIESLTAQHCYAGAKPIVGGRESWEHQLTPVTEETKKNFPEPVSRPLVRAHTVTGRLGLYAPAGSIFQVNGVNSDEAETLIRQIKQHATSEPYCYAHQYRPGDLLMWDNTSTLHFGKPTEAATGEHDSRLMYRMSPLGVPAALLNQL